MGPKVKKGNIMLKKILILIIAVVIIFTTTTECVKADETVYYGSYSEEFCEDNYCYKYYYSDGVGTLRVTDLVTGEIKDVISYDISDKSLNINGDISRVDASISFGNSTYLNSYSTNEDIRSFNYNSSFSVSPTEATTVVATIATIASTLATAAACGLTFAMLKSGAESIVNWIGKTYTLQNVFQWPSLNGIVSFTQQINLTTNKVRNINRCLKLKLSSSSSYRSYYYSDTTWFTPDF